MVRSSVLLTAAAAVFSTNFGAAKALFSVHDDILAFPQFQVSIIMDSYYTEEEAAQILSPPPKPSSDPEPTSSSTSTSTGNSASSTDSAADPEYDPDSADATIDHPRETYETMFWSSHKYLCSVPIVKPPPPLNATEKELNRLAEEKELARATTRGWELLSEMDGKCLYFISGWWSYSFCYGREIKQFHQLPARDGSSIFPPKEDPATASYVLGRVGAGDAGANAGGPGGTVGGRKGAAAGEGTELQGSGEVRYLVQKMGGGTVCDITGKDRRIEIQYHCNPSSTDRIGFVKEVSICCYLMVVYTPRLCNDVAFLPPREGNSNLVQCKEVMNPEQIEEWKIKRAKEEHLQKLVGEFEKVVDGGEGGKKRGNKKKGIGAGVGGGVGVGGGGGGDKGSGSGKIGGSGNKIKVKVMVDDEEVILEIPQGHDEL